MIERTAPFVIQIPMLNAHTLNTEAYGAARLIFRFAGFQWKSTGMGPGTRTKRRRRPRGGERSSPTESRSEAETRTRRRRGQGEGSEAPRLRVGAKRRPE